MSKRSNGNNLITDYLSIKKQIKRLVIKAEKSLPIPQVRLIKKISSLLKRMLIIEKDCKSMGLPHPDSLDSEPGPTVSQINKELFGTPSLRAVLNPDGTLYSKHAMYQKEGLEVLSKMMIRSSPDGRLFETPPLEGSFLARRDDTE